MLMLKPRLNQKENLFESEDQMSLKMLHKELLYHRTRTCTVGTRQVALANEEAQKLIPKPKLIVFAAFQLTRSS
jgi:hypothetical protein